jgi:hypothetical protein
VTKPVRKCNNTDSSFLSIKSPSSRICVFRTRKESTESQSFYKVTKTSFKSRLKTFDLSGKILEVATFVWCTILQWVDPLESIVKCLLFVSDDSDSFCLSMRYTLTKPSNTNESDARVRLCSERGEFCRM